MDVEGRSYMSITSGSLRVKANFDCLVHNIYKTNNTTLNESQYNFKIFD